MAGADAEGLRELYAASYRRLVGQIAAMTGDIGEAEDLVQEAFARRWPGGRRSVPVRAPRPGSASSR